MTHKDKQLYRKGVGAVLFNKDGRVFVAQRIDTPGDAWQMPQGGIDKGEDPADAVMRELEEEIGTNHAEIIEETKGWLYYDIPDGLSRTLWGGKYKGQRQKWFALRYLGHDDHIDIQAHHHPEFSEWKWVALDQVPDLIVPFKQSLYKDIVERFSHIPAMLAKADIG